MERRPESQRQTEADRQQFSDEEMRPSGNYGNRSDGNKSKIAIIILAIAVAVLATVYVAEKLSNHKLVSALTEEKQELLDTLNALQIQYDGLSSDYEIINSQLDSSRAEITELIERVKKADATNRAVIGKYRRELGTLRSIMKGYVKQIDSLNTLNHSLSAAAAAARREAASVKKQNKELQQTVEDLSDKVEVGSIVKGGNVRIVAISKGGKQVDKAGKVESLCTSLSLSANSFATPGPLTVYIIVKDQDGNLLQNADSRSCNYAGSVMETSASREIEYTGEAIDISIYLNNLPALSKGLYTVQVLTEKALIGQSQLMLR